MCIRDRYIEIDNIAEESDGDQIVYSFFKPVTFENGNYPDPPPYLELPYKLPFYSFQQPFGQDADLYLDPNTGQLSFTAKHSGNFLVGIAAEEYRNGELISSTKREIQIIVSDCAPKVEAKIVADTINNDGAFVINICNEDSYFIENISTIEENISSYKWSFNDLESQELDVWSPTLSFPNGGSYHGELRFCLLYTSPSPRDRTRSRMPSSA